MDEERGDRGGGAGDGEAGGGSGGAGTGAGAGGGSGEGAAAPSPRRRRRRLFDARAEAAVARALRGGASYSAAARAAGFGVSTVYAAKARSAPFRALCEAAVAESDGEVAIAPGNGRRLQFRRVRRRLFGTKLKDLFLEHFAGTCSIAASAEAVGVARSTVNKHLAEDEDFRERFDRTLEIAYRHLESEQVRLRLEAAARPQVDGGAAGADPAEFDRALQLIREHKRGRPGGPDRRPGRPGRHASLDEVCLALARRLKAFPPTGTGDA
ncbi:MAG TPA: hypothetical protein VF574_14520 [Allosphingosinicella sp.]|jgi:hypothetical protein